MSALGNLVVSIAMDTLEFDKGIDKTSKESQKLAKELDQKLNRSIRMVTDGFKGFALGALGAVGATLSVSAAISKLNNTFLTLDKAAKDAQRFGVPIEQLTALQFAANLSGVSVDKLGDSMKDLLKNASEAANGVQGQSNLFRALGVDVTDASGKVRSASDLIGDLAEVFSGLDDGATKTNLAMKVFGESGKELIPMLNAGRDGIKGMTDEAERAGVVMGSETAKAAEMFNDNMSRLAGSVDSLFIGLAEGLLPSLVDVTNEMVAGTRAAGEFGAGIEAALSKFTNDFVRSASPAERIKELEQTIKAIESYTNSGESLGPFGMDKFLGFDKEGLASKKAELALYKKELDDIITSIVAPPTQGASFDLMQQNRDKERKAAEQRIRDLLAQADASKLAAEATKAQQKAEREYAAQMKELGQQNQAYDELVAYLDQHDEYLKAREAETKAMREQLEEIGLTDRALAELRSRRMRETAALKESTAAKEQDTFAAEKLRKEAEELRKQADLSAEIFNRQQVANSAKVLADEYKKVNEEISRSLTDALVRGFESGKTLAQSFGDYLKNYFKTLVVRVAVQPVAAGLGAAVGSILLPGGVQAAQGGGAAGADPLASAFFADPVGTIKSAYSALTSGGSLLTANSAAEFSSIISDFGFELATQGGFLQDFGASLFNNAEGLGKLSQAAGVAFTALSAFNSLKDGKYLSAVGTGFGYALGGPLGATLGNFVGGALDKLFGFGKSGGRNAFGTFNTLNGENTGTEARFKNEADFDGQIAEFGQAFEKRYLQLTQALGGMAGDIGTYIRIKTDIGGDSPSDAYFSTVLNGQNVLSTGGGGVGRSDEALKAALEGQAVRNLVAVLQKTDFADNLDAIFDTANAASDTLERLNSVLEKANLVRYLNLNLNVFADNIRNLTLVSAESLDALIGVAGGTEQLSAALSAYMNVFATDSERLANAQEQLRSQFESLNIQVPESTAELRKLIDAQDLTTSSGRETYLALIALAETFKQVKATEEQVQAAIAQTTQRTRDYINLLNGDTKTALQQIAGQIAETTEQLYSTTDPLQRIALEGQLADLVFQRYEAELGMLGKIMSVTQEVMAGFEAQRIASTAARQQITGQGPLVMSASQIRAGIQEATELGALPSALGLQTANERVAALNAQRDSQAAAIDILRGQESQAQEFQASRQVALAEQVELAKKAAGLFNANVTYGTAIGRGAGGGRASAAFNSATNRVSVDYQDIQYQIGREGDVHALRDQLKRERDELGGLSINAGVYGANGRISAAERAFENSAQAYAAKILEISQAQARAAEIGQNLATAEIQRAQAQEEFAEQIQQYVLDAGKATSKLSKLREETLKYFEQQQALANLMTGSAQNIRGVVQQVRYNSLSSMDQLNTLQAQFATAYSAGLVSSGEALAGYGDTLASLIDPTLQKAAEVFGEGSFEYDRLRGILLNQAEAIAGRLEGLTPKDYQRDSLALLDTIDSSLALIEEHTRSAEALIVDAINNSKSATVDALRQLLNAMQGNPVQAFSVGGLVRGPGTTTSDQIRAALSTDEYVMQAGAVRKFGVGFMDQINDGYLPMARIPGLSNARSMAAGDQDMLNELRRIEGAVQRLERTVMIGDAQIAKNTGEVARVYKRADDGDAVRVRAVE